MTQLIKTPIAACVHASPIGPLRVSADPAGRLCGLVPSRAHEQSSEGFTRDQQRLMDRTRKQLDAYFAGHLIAFDLPLVLAGTNFQRRVWDELRKIPLGQTISYKRLAQRIGSPKATQAVGGANGANPIYIVVPCHRVIATDGSLGGYGGGLDAKRTLLDLEARATGQLLG